jgi:hypothetical protein
LPTAESCTLAQGATISSTEHADARERAGGGAGATIREQARVFEQISGQQRAEMLDRLARLRAELAGLIAQSEARAGGSEPLAEAGRLCAEGYVVLVPSLPKSAASC